jgi:fatty-acyl-CoA synthase
MGITHKDSICISVPLYHCFGMVIGNLVACNNGAAMVYPSEGFDPVAALDAVTKHKCTAIYGVPTMFIAYLEEYAKNKDKYDLSSLRTGFVAGSGCPEALMHRIHKEMGIN